MESMEFTSLLEEAHFNMIRRLLFSSILATQFIAFSAIVRDDAFRGSEFASGNGRGSLTAALQAEDPLPCPECDPPNDLSLRLASVPALRAEDPLPCPECDPPNDLALTLASLPALRAEDPLPCPECDPPNDLALTLAPLAALRAEDPVPCPECDPPNASLTSGALQLASLRAEDPVPCPECDPPNDLRLTLVLL